MSQPPETADRRPLLARLLEAPQQIVPHLPAETLHQLIRHRGLEACGDLVACATPDQLTAVFDLDLWQSTRAGLDARFDAGRFGEWLEVLAETGTDAAVRALTAMDANLTIAGFARFIRVFDLATLEPSAASDDEPFAMARGATGDYECEVAGLLVRGRPGAPWDAIVAILTALDADAPDCFRTIVRGVTRLSDSIPEADGLDDLLDAQRQADHVIAIGREGRRERQGFSTPADARAFLDVARTRRGDDAARAVINPVAAAYARDLAQAAELGDPLDAPAGRAPADGPMTPDVAEVVQRVTEIVGALDANTRRPHALTDGRPAVDARLEPLRTLLADLRDRDPGAYAARTGELAFLANALIAGCSVQSRAFRPQEAFDAAAATCNLALDHVSAPHPAGLLRTRDLVTLFEDGWGILYEQVSLFVARRLAAALADLRVADAEILLNLHGLRRELLRQCDAGTPWRACEALEAMSPLDLPTWAGLCGLLDECPVVPAILVSIVEGRAGSVSPTAFEFISTRRQLAQVHAFIARLPVLLAP